MTEWVKQGNLLGPVGPVGPANELVVGDVEALPYDQPPTVTISPVTASPPYQVIDFGIPAGQPGTGNIQWDDILGKPATFPPTVPIAYTDISGKPATYPPTLPIPWSGISGTPATFPPTLPVPWSGLSGVPSTFPPAAHTHPQAEVDNLISDLALKAPLASPALTGAPTAPTAAPGTNSTQLATTAFVGAALATTGASVGTSAPPTSLGKFWWHPTEKTLRIWDGTAWQAVLATWA